ncbi:MAG: hypothetical protein NXI30_20585 [bacterium]|nr:hypothetical protein [bacterium]
MNARGVILGLFGILALGVAVALLRPSAPEAPAGDAAPRPGAATEDGAGTRGLGATRETRSADDSAAEAAIALDPEAELEAARSQLAGARETLREAERQLDELEREVEAVEQFVENIEERGEDPARYAFEGMDQLNPIIERYEARFAKVVEAEEALAAAEARVGRAEAAVSRAPASE